MAKQVDRSKILDQLEDLKKGLSSILQGETTSKASDSSSENGHSDLSAPEKEIALNDTTILENFKILGASKQLIETGGSEIEHNLNEQGSQTLILLDDKFQVVAFNRGAEATVKLLCGKELKFGIGMNELLPSDDIEQFTLMLTQVSNGLTLHLTSRLAYDQNPGQWYEINLYPVLNNQSKVNRIVWRMEDVKQRKAAQANLKALQINFQSVFKQAAVSVVLRNTNLQLIQANYKFFELIEYTADEFKALPPLSITHPRDLPESKRLLKLLVEGELDSFSLEQRLITKTGKIVWVYLTTNIVKDANGKPKLIISVAQDITDRKHAEQELVFKSNELDTFIYRASHDLRGPVASLMGLYNVVQTEFKQDNHAMEYFEHYHKSVLRLNKILHNLIDLTKIKEKEIEPSEVDVKDIISECLSSVSNVINFEKVHFKIKNSVDFKILTDASTIKTIIFHLLENAVNFMQIDNEQSFVKLTVKYESNFLVIEVADNGQGIKKELQSEVFNMFYRANERSTGSGLGLYIVRYAVEKLNGSIQLKSKELSGTKISVYIPYLHKPLDVSVEAVG